MQSRPAPWPGRPGAQDWPRDTDPGCQSRPQPSCARGSCAQIPSFPPQLCQAGSLLPPSLQVSSGATLRPLPKQGEGVPHPPSLCSPRPELSRGHGWRLMCTGPAVRAQVTTHHQPNPSVKPPSPTRKLRSGRLSHSPRIALLGKDGGGNDGVGEGLNPDTTTGVTSLPNTLGINTKPPAGTHPSPYSPCSSHSGHGLLLAMQAHRLTPQVCLPVWQTLLQAPDFY